MKNMVAVLAGVVLCSACLNGSDIPISNWSFEDPVILTEPPADTWNSGFIAGWLIEGGAAGVWKPFVGQHPAGYQGCLDADPSQSFVEGIDGRQVAYSNSGDLKQSTSVQITAGYRYTLKVSIGGRCSVFSGKPYAVMLAGGSDLAAETGLNQANRWFEQTVTYTTLPDDLNAGQMLTIKLVNNDGVQLDFDNVRLDASRVLTCEGFQAPFDQPVELKKKQHKAIPIRMVLRDLLGAIVSDSGLSAVPVVDVARIGPPISLGSNTPDLVPPGHADDGNELRYDSRSMQWVLNLDTKQFSASGTYRVSVLPGDDSYVIDPGCSQSFVRR